MQTLVGLFDQPKKTFEHCYEEKLVQILVDCFGFKQKQPTYLNIFDVFWIALKVWLKFCSQTCIPLEILIEFLQSKLHTP